MAISSNSNRLPSPNPTRTNPNSRTQESNSIRKSFSGDPFTTRPSIVPYPRNFNPVTPANSPADFSQRNSGGLRNSYDQKENEKEQNLKTARVRSPVVSTGTKSFMAPTISASSKINPSPRKKVLTERNEPVRTSISFSAEKSPFTALNLSSEIAEEVNSNSETIINHEVPLEIPKKLDATLVSPVTNPKVAFVNSEFLPTETLEDPLLFSPEPRAAVVDSRCNNPDLDSSKVVKSSSSPLAPLDLDPSLPPYDPKTNYLSPRPQFLHYKPNPRIDVYLNKERGFDDDPGEGTCLLERFSSESGSETEISEGSSQFSSPEKECEDAACSSEMVLSEVENENQNCFSKPEIQNEDNRVIGTHHKKSHFLGKSKSLSLIFVLVVACSCIPVTHTPINYYPSLTYSRFDSPVKIAELAKTKLDDLSHDVRLWSVNSVSYLSKLISIPNQVEQQMGPLEFVNSTISPDEVEHLADYGDNETEEMRDVDTVEMTVEEEMAGIIVLASDLEPENPETGEFVDKIESHDFDTYTNIAVAEEECSSNIENEEQSSPLLPQVQEVESEMLESDSEGENDTDSFSNIEPTYAEATAKSLGSDYWHGSSHHGLESQESSSLQGSTYSFTEGNVLGISSVVLVLLLVAALLYLKQNKVPSSAPNAAVPVEQQKKKYSLCSVSASTDHLNHERASMGIWPAVVEKVGESGPSEMSSTLQGGSSDRANEVQSHHDRKPKRSTKGRESLASSSEFSAGSPSYGSFTIYEKTQNKHGSGDEEIVTPIRRSSRIRNHQ